MSRFGFFDGRLADIEQVNRLPIDANDAAQLASAVFQKVIDHR